MRIRWHQTAFVAAGIVLFVLCVAGAGAVGITLGTGSAFKSLGPIVCMLALPAVSWAALRTAIDSAERRVPKQR